MHGKRIQHWLCIGPDGVVICRDLARHGVISRYHETIDKGMTNVMNKEMMKTVMVGLCGKGSWDL